MRTTYFTQANQSDDVTVRSENTIVFADAEQDYYAMVADHGADSAEALVAWKYLRWLDRRR